LSATFQDAESDPTVNAPSVDARRKADQQAAVIQNNLPLLRAEDYPLDALSAEGGSLTVMADGDVIQFAKVVLYGETGQLSIDYYYNDQELPFLAVATRTDYLSPFGETAENLVSRHYFGVNGQAVSGTADNKNAADDNRTQAATMETLNEVAARINQVARHARVLR
jgi:hypothetical protein